MKKILFGLIVIFSFNNFRTARPVKDHGQLQVIGTQLCDEKVNPVVNVHGTVAEAPQPKRAVILSTTPIPSSDTPFIE